jgi:hypothetical protein
MSFLLGLTVKKTLARRHCSAICSQFKENTSHATKAALKGKGLILSLANEFVGRQSDG